MPLSAPKSRKTPHGNAERTKIFYIKMSFKRGALIYNFEIFYAIVLLILHYISIFKNYLLYQSVISKEGVDKYERK